MRRLIIIAIIALAACSGSYDTPNTDPCAGYAKHGEPGHDHAHMRMECEG